MARASFALATFNRGLVSRLGAARQDIKRLALGASRKTNWVARSLGAMNIRPGTQYLGSTKSDLAPRLIPFVFSLSDKALIELTNTVMRVWIDGALITRAAVSTAVANGAFTTNLASWTDDDEAGGVSQWASPGYMELVGNGTAAARRTQQLTIALADQNVEHALNVTIARGPVVLRIGSTAGDDDLLAETELGEGSHSLAFTPTGASAFVRFQSTLLRRVYVDSVSIAAAGTMEVTSPWTTADLDNLREDTSGDVTFVACTGKQQYKIERRATRSWSIVKYLPEDGPFLVENTGPITMTPSVATGNGTLTASAAFFKATNVGSLMSVTHTGQRASASISAAGNWTTDVMHITGTGTARAITINLSGTWVATVTLQRSTSSSTGPWTDVTTYTANTTTSYNDGLDNQEAWYRIGVDTGDYTSGTVEATLNAGVGETNGVARITAVTSALVAEIEVLAQFAALTASDVWAEGMWSPRRGWPSAVAFHEGRIWWAGKDRVIGSVSDAFYSFDIHTEGDSGPIIRSIGSGPVDTINWMMSLQRLVIGGQAREYSARSSSLDEPLTPTAFNLKASSGQGSSSVSPTKVGSTGIFVQRGGTRVYELAIDPQTYDYAANHLSAVVPEVGKPRIVRAAMQMQPEPRWHGVRSDGTVAILLFDRSEQLICWSEYETDGDVVDVAVLPGAAGTDEDEVYYAVQRTINGSTKCYLERWALESDCRPVAGVLTSCKLADSFVTFTGTPTTTVTGLGHLEGKQVVIWADGTDQSYAADDTTLLYTVTGGQITVSTAVATGVVGLPYTAQWRSTKLAQLQTEAGTALTAHKSVWSIGLILADTHYRGLQFGRDFSTLDDMPSVEEGYPVSAGTLHTDYDAESTIWPGDYSTDERVCLQARAPRPCTVVAAIIDEQVNA